MMKTRPPIPEAHKKTLIISFLLLSCGSAQKQEPPDPLALLAEGRYSEAREAIVVRDDIMLRDLAIIAFSQIAEHPNRSSKKMAIETLTKMTDPVDTAIAANEMLILMSTLPSEFDSEFSLMVVDVALSAVGLGSMSTVAPTLHAGSEVSESLAISVLECLHLRIYKTRGSVNFKALLDVWNSCYILLGASLSMDDPVKAWKLYTSVGGLAIASHENMANSDLSKVLVLTTVKVVEQNPQIAVAAQCDNSSLFNRLCKILEYDPETRTRFEQAVVSAEGCGRRNRVPEATQ